MKDLKVKLAIEDSYLHPGAIFKDSITNLELCVSNPKYFWKDCEYYHMHFLSDEKIQDGDWYLVQNGFTVLCCGKNDDHVSTAEKLASSKIIATTNKHLIKSGIDEINDSFLKLYVDMYNSFRPIENIKYENGTIITAEQSNKTVDTILESIMDLPTTDKMIILKNLVNQIPTTDVQLTGLLNKISSI